MCGRYRRTTAEEEIARQYNIPIPPQLDLPISYNVAPSQNVLVIRQNSETKQSTLSSLKWGLVPIWAKDEKIAHKTISLEHIPLRYDPLLIANEIVPPEMHKPLLDLIATGERILGRLTRNDIRQIQPVIRQDLDLLHELVAKLDAGFEASKDRPNGTGPVRDGGKTITIHGGT